jgi:serine/threonine protein kinase
MGVVWRARDRLLDRDVAIKEVVLDTALAPDERENAYQRTLREARTAARLSHRGLVTVFDVVEEDGRPWIVMELVVSRSLEAMIASDGPLPPRRACRIGQQLLAALAAAHAAGVLHRDVKPSNVLIAQEAGTRDGERAVLTDFGIAQFQGDPRLTQTGMVMGSPGFTAPERIRGGSATPASDLWSLGATIYAAVEGQGPYEERGGPITTMTAIINEDAPYARRGRTLAQVIDALLRRNPAARPSASVAARMFAQALPLLPDSPAKPRLVPPRRAETVSPTKPLGATSSDGTHPGTVPSHAETAPDDARAPEEDSASKPVTETEDAEDTAPDEAVSDDGVSGDANDSDTEGSDTEGSEDSDSAGGSGRDIAAGTAVGEAADEPVDDDMPETHEDVPGSGSGLGSPESSGTDSSGAESSGTESSGAEGHDTESGHAESGGRASASADDDPEAEEEPDEPAEDSTARSGPAEDDTADDAPASDAGTGHIAPADDTSHGDTGPADADPADTEPADTVSDDGPADRDLANIPTVVDAPAPSPAGARPAQAGPAKPMHTDLTRTDPGSSGYAAAGTGYRTASGYRPGNYQAAGGYRPDNAYQAGSYQGQGQAGGAYAPGRPAAAARDPRQNGPEGFAPALPPSTRKGAGARGGRGPGQTRWGRWAILAAVAVVLAAAIGVGAAFLIQHDSGANASDNTGNSSAQTVQNQPTAVQMIDNQAAAPAGWQTTTVSAATTGTTAGFSVTAPANWTVKQSKLATIITAPDSLRYVEVDLTPHHYANMLSEAEYIQNTAISDEHFPGYHLVSLEQATIRGTSGAFWAFTWVRPDGTTMRVNDLIFVLQTPAGPQSYAIYVTAPNAQFGGSEGLGTFGKVLASFKKVPAQS